MAKNVANAEVKNEVVNVEDVNKEVSTTVEEEAQAADKEKGFTDEEVKANAIIRARLPKLVEKVMQFDRRSGNFIRRSLVTVTDKNGAPLYDGNGNELKKNTSLTIPLIEIDEETGKPILDENGNVIPTDAALYCNDEIMAKRAARTVLNYDRTMEDFAKEEERLEKELAALRGKRDSYITDWNEAKELVMLFKLPESASARVSLTAKVEKQESIISAMRAKMVAAGVSEEEIDELVKGM